MKNIRCFYLKIFSFFEVKFSIYMYLNRWVFVMCAIICIFSHSPLFLSFLSSTCSLSVSPFLLETTENDLQGLTLVV